MSASTRMSSERVRLGMLFAFLFLATMGLDHLLSHPGASLFDSRVTTHAGLVAILGASLAAALRIGRDSALPDSAGPRLDSEGSSAEHRRTDEDDTHFSGEAPPLWVDREHTLRWSRKVWDDSRDAMRVIDPSGIIVDVNDAFCRLVEKPRHELVGQPLSVIYQPSRQSHILRMFRQRSMGRAVEQIFERQDVLWNGKTVWFELSNTFLLSPRLPFPYILSVFREVSVEKRRERRLRLVEAAAALADDAWLVFKATPARDDLGVVEWASDRVPALTDPSAETIIGAPLRRVLDAVASPADVAAIRDALRRDAPLDIALNGPQGAGLRLRVCPVLDSATGAFDWVAAIVNNPGGSRVGFGTHGLAALSGQSSETAIATAAAAEAAASKPNAEPSASDSASASDSVDSGSESPNPAEFRSVAGEGEDSAETIPMDAAADRPDRP